MRVVVARCSVTYTGRGDTNLAVAVRAIVVKDDGSVSVHNDKSNKPLNYMGKGNVFSENINIDGLVWNFDTTKESLQIKMHSIISDTDFLLDVHNVELVRDGTESQLQAWLALNPDALGEGYVFVQREFQTGAGPVDLMVLDGTGNPVIVEVKRTAMLASVSQIKRYLDNMVEQEGYAHTIGMIAALDIRPKTKALAERRGILCVTIPSNWRDSIDIS